MTVWWQTTRTPKQGFLLATMWLVIALVSWLGLLATDASGLLLTITTVGFTLLGVLYLTSAFALYRRGSAP